MQEQNNISQPTEKIFYIPKSLLCRKKTQFSTLSLPLSLSLSLSKQTVLRASLKGLFKTLLNIYDIAFK